MAELSKIFDLMSSIYKIDFSKAGTFIPDSVLKSNVPTFRYTLNMYSINKTYKRYLYVYGLSHYLLINNVADGMINMVNYIYVNSTYDIILADTGEDNKLILLCNKFYNNSSCKILKSRLSVANLRKKLELPNDLKIISNLEELLDRYHSINLINSF